MGAVPGEGGDQLNLRRSLVGSEVWKIPHPMRGGDGVGLGPGGTPTPFALLLVPLQVCVQPWTRGPDSSPQSPAFSSAPHLTSFRTPGRPLGLTSSPRPAHHGPSQPQMPPNLINGPLFIPHLYSLFVSPPCPPSPIHPTPTPPSHTLPAPHTPQPQTHHGPHLCLPHHLNHSRACEASQSSLSVLTPPPPLLIPPSHPTSVSLLNLFLFFLPLPSPTLIGVRDHSFLPRTSYL